MSASGRECCVEKETTKQDLGRQDAKDPLATHTALGSQGQCLRSCMNLLKLLEFFEPKFHHL